MKFVAKKSQCCARKGYICHEFETNDVEKMAQFILNSYSYGGDSDRRDDDYACLYDSLTDFEKEKFTDSDERAAILKDYAGKIKYQDLPKGSKMLYTSGGFGWDLIPVHTTKDIINELVSMNWSDLDIDFTE